MYNMAGLLPWFVLAAAIVLLRENRTKQVLWILLPVPILKGLLWSLTLLPGLPSSASMLFTSLADGLLAGFVLNWLLSERIARRSRFITFLLAMLVFVIACGLMLVNYQIDTNALGLSIMFAVSASVLLVSFVLARFMCRRKFSHVRFSLWLALWVYVFVNALFLVIAAIQLIALGWEQVVMLLGILIGAGIFSGILIVSLLPFEIVLFKTGFWCTRFEKLLKLQTKPKEMPLELKLQEQSDNPVNPVNPV